MIESIIRIRAIAVNTLTEALRQKVMLVVVLCGLVFIAGSLFMADLAFREQFKFLKDLGYAGISITGMVVALIGAAQLIPAEIERRTLYTTLAKPVWRFEFILGKYIGLIALLSIIVIMLSTFFSVILLIQEMRVITIETPLNWLQWLLGSSDHLNDGIKSHIEEIQNASRDPRLIQAVLLVWAKLCVIGGLAVLLSTIASSTSFIVSITLMVYLVGNLLHIVRLEWGEHSVESTFLKITFITLVGWLVPDFELYNLIDEIIAGKNVSWSMTLEMLQYSALYVTVLLALAAAIFEGREF
ncbi:MAG: ABC transporter permease subunit [Verrucomicrobiota bacterium]